ncbi:FKBP-type peptidyl-prolyl cis-trans isomerase [Candidatus Parcubacteria bacterium]|nr:FKBP-type peptidyl-prolyl cis-trans isomerase [Candidatus Parcubacteria bacterium]
MKPIQTGIAAALALTVVVLFFVVPGLWPFQTSTSPAGTAGQAAAVNATTTQTTNPIATTTMPTANQLSINDEVVGTGAVAAVGDSVTVNYVGALTNGTVFDASANHGTGGFTFTLGAGQVIKGWDEGIVGMKVGGKRILVIPASLAYGDRAIGNIIPANSTLVFKVELLKVQKPAQ